MGGGVDKSSCKGRCQKISKSISLLKHSTDNAASGLWAILQCGCCSITVQSSHCNAKEGTAGKELLVCLAEAGSQLEDDKEEVIDNEGPLSTISVCRDTEDG